MATKAQLKKNQSQIHMYKAPRKSSNRIPLLLLSFIYLCIWSGCHPAKTDQEESANNIISPIESLSRMKIENGFEVRLVAAEPLVSAPIAMTFDQQGRMWVVEMQGYMPNADGEGENIPNGKIVILEDSNDDGVADHRTVVLDSLVLPRGICLVEDGMLLITPPSLWFVKLHNDQPIKWELVDSAYTTGDNVEGQANGLYRGRDNWIYNTRSDKRYRKEGNHWRIEPAHLRGQWSLSNDNLGRLFYNNNSQNLLGDFFMPGMGTLNPNQRRIAGFSEVIVPDNRVYPAHPTTGVNRGYQPGILDSLGRLQKFTAASGPVIYRGALFGKEYAQNAFVCEPAANLIKRNILEWNGNEVSGHQAYEGREFLTSTDERFRPVTLYNGPDGALYILDMYRGIIQHKSLMTKYLRGEIQKRNLEQPVHCGRIYKIVPSHSDPKKVQFTDNPIHLVKLLQHPNGWVRDKAQQLLVDGKYRESLPLLRKSLYEAEDAITVSHILWTLEGIGDLKENDIVSLLHHKDVRVRQQALAAMGKVMTSVNYDHFVPILEHMIEQHDSLLAPYIAFQTSILYSFDSTIASHIIRLLAVNYSQDRYVVDAIVSSLHNRETTFYQHLHAIGISNNTLLAKRLENTIETAEQYKNNKNDILLRRKYPRGVALFKSVCQTCHGADGNGVALMAPPLNTSEWVMEKKDRLIAIVVFGVTGPLSVNGKTYAPPEINGDMPAMGDNPDIVDEDLAQVLNFIRNRGNHHSSLISSRDINRVRKRFIDRKQPFTADELDTLKW